MVVGGSWGATLALAYAQAHPERVSGIVLRATFLGTRTELDSAFLQALPLLYPGLSEDFIGLLPAEERGAPIEAYWRRILDPDAAIHGLAARAWGETERILSEHAPNRVRLDIAALRASRALPSTPFMEAHYFQNDCFMKPDQLMNEAEKARRHSRHHRAGPLRPALPAGDLACAGGEMAGFGSARDRRRRPFAVRSRHQGCRDEGDRGSRFQNQTIERQKCRWPEKACC